MKTLEMSLLFVEALKRSQLKTKNGLDPKILQVAREGLKQERGTIWNIANDLAFLCTEADVLQHCLFS